MDIKNLHKDGRWNAPWLPVWRPEDGPHPRKRPRSLCFESLLALLMLLMVACTAVKDPSERWKASGMDPKLEGEWKETKKEVAEEAIAFAKHDGGWYAFANGDKGHDPVAVRTFERGGMHFMLMVQTDAAQRGFEKMAENDRSGNITLYEIKDDTLTLSLLRNELVAKAIKEGKIKGEVPPQKEDSALPPEPSVATLDDATCDALAELAKDKDAWQKVAEYKRVKPVDGKK